MPNPALEAAHGLIGLSFRGYGRFFAAFFRRAIAWR